MGDLGYKNIQELIIDLWESESDEIVKRDCLVFIDKYLNDPKLMKKYIGLSEREEGIYLQEYIKELKINKNYR